MGDAAATGHFSIGSGSRLAFDSAIALAEYLHSEPTMQAAFERYQDERRVEVLRLQSAARNSLEWFEQVERYLDMPPVQFAYSLLTRSQRISHENLRLRDPDWLRPAEDWFQAQAGGQPGRAPMFAPFRLRDMSAEEPHRRLADGAVQGRRRLPDRLASRPLCRTRQGRGGAGLYRNDLRQRPRAASPPAAPAFMRPSMRRRGSGWSISSMPRRRRRSAARSAIRAQGVHPARLGRDGRPAACRATGR